MRKNVILSKIAGLTLACFALSLSLNAQNLVVNGNMPAQADTTWKVGWRNGSADQSSVEFGVTEDLPDGAISSTAAKINYASSGWNETQLWQVVTLTAGTKYFLNAKLKIEVPEANTWVQAFLKPWEEPTLSEQNAFADPQLATATQLLQVKEWSSDSPETIIVDGDFPKNISGNIYLLGESLTPEETGDYIVLFKFGGGVAPQTCILTDVVLSAGITGVNVLNKNSVKVYPSVANNFINVAGLTSIANTEIYNVNGSLVLSSHISNNQKINVSQLPSGIYFLKVETAQGESTHKFTKR